VLLYEPGEFLFVLSFGFGGGRGLGDWVVGTNVANRSVFENTHVATNGELTRT